MNKEVAEQFANEWIAAWNNHDLGAIMHHYSNDIEFHSPIIQMMAINAAGILNNKVDLEAYFKAALKKFPDLKFELFQALTGINSVILYYRSVNNMLAAEYMELNDDGAVVKVKAHYNI